VLELVRILWTHRRVAGDDMRSLGSYEIDDDE